LPAELRAHFGTQTDAMVALLEDLMRLESPTSDPKAVNGMGQRVAEELDKLGAALTTHPRTEVGDIVEARWNEDQPGKPIVVVCHMDTVHPIGMLEANPIRQEDGKLYGPGSYDMKGSIVTTLAALKGLRDLEMFPDRPLVVLMTSDEETGSEHSRGLIEERARGAALAMIMEPALPDGSIKTWRKSTGGFTIKTFGIAAHAGGSHESGLNAIEEMAHQVIALQRMTNYKVGTTVSAGIISGGTARNTVPDMCEVFIDVRAMTREEMDRLTKQILAIQPVLPGARLEVEGGFDRPPMERNETMIATFNRAKIIAKQYNLTVREAGSGGASDGNYTAALGTPTLDGLGPVGDGAHSEREHIVMASLADSATLIASLLMDWPRA
jgi:glutamate carboxypeptidase